MAGKLHNIANVLYETAGEIDLQSYKTGRGACKMPKMIIAVAMFVWVLSGCGLNSGSNTTGNPTANDVLSTNPDANIFMYQDIIYSAGINWVDELTLTKDKEITEVKEQRKDGKEFRNGTANKLKAGTKIFSAKERNDIIIAETADGEVRFYSLIEG
ncbi:hypothetical protein [Paenibacillus typhae]|uniref:Uncharacterized protein n=1 Tax=Paenibacillus typhae TaxID=1174501 RepID=A0A1G8M8G8_9BACL|nr:hypothetical protein [Paenibacillus typhae]SDI64234.1 hypothetical protein SAMN05216192_10732 [Paenibacillus typhae]